jgi:hypothetical protein
MTTKLRYPSYAVIARATPDALADAAARARGELGLSDDGWEIQPGPKGYTALWDFTPGGGTAYAIAPLISKQVAGTIYVAQLDEHLHGTSAYERGKSLGEVEEGPVELAARLGVPFPSRPVVFPGRKWSVVIVEGAGPAVVEPSLGLDPSGREVVRVEDHPLGTMIYAVDDSGVTGLGPLVAGPGLETVTTYELERSFDGDLLQAWIYRGGTMTHFFTSDDSYGLGPPSVDRVWAIKSAGTVRGIVEALQVPVELLGLSSEAIDGW